MSENYDVIIIRTGAGGALWPTPGAVREGILLLERGHFLPREMDNGIPSRCS